jgi:hypothetical protein
MNLQNLEYTRIEVRRALLDLSGATKGQLEAFSENPPADNNKNPRCAQPSCRSGWGDWLWPVGG